MSDIPRPILNVADAPVHGSRDPHFGHEYQILTPTMRERGGSLGLGRNRLPPGNVTCPFHWHAREDEVFFVLSGRGVLRYGEALYPIGPGDCIECPAGTGIAHQIGNPYDEDLVYLAVGPHDPDEVCHYPDSGKWLVRAAKRVGHFEPAGTMDGEPETPRLFALWEARTGT